MTNDGSVRRRPWRSDRGSLGRLEWAPAPCVRLTVAFLVVAGAAAVKPPAVSAQFASIAVSAEVVASDDADLGTIVGAVLPQTDSTAADSWTEHVRIGRPAVTRTRLRNEPRTGQPGAGLVVDVIVDYVGN